MTSLTPSDVARILASPVQGLKLLFVGSGSGGGEKKTKKRPRVLSRSFASPEGSYPYTYQVSPDVDELLMENPAASERAPLLQEEGKATKSGVSSPISLGKDSDKLERGAIAHHGDRRCSKFGCWYFVSLFILAGLSFQVSLIAGSAAHGLVKMEMSAVENKRVALSSLVALIAGSTSSAVTMKHFATTQICVLVCTLAFALGALLPAAPWLINVYAAGTRFGVLHQTIAMATSCSCFVYACGAYLESRVARIDVSSWCLHPLLRGLKHVFYVALLAGVALCFGFVVDSNPDS